MTILRAMLEHRQVEIRYIPKGVEPPEGWEFFGPASPHSDYFANPQTTESQVMEIRHPVTDDVLFSHDELASRDDGTVKLAKGFDNELLNLRLSFGRPMRVNSCCRTPAHNKAVGGGLMSYHLTEGNLSHGTCAIDIHVPDDSYRAVLVRMALSTNWAVGVYPTFVHLDRRSDFGKSPLLFHGK